jgi:hypothetical protein
MMSIETARSFFLWCSVINYALLLVGVVAVTLGRRPLYGLTSRIFRMTPEQYDLFGYAWIVLYETGILLFNLVPLIALHLIK